jgi:hypothetical protein
LREESNSVYEKQQELPQEVNDREPTARVVHEARAGASIEKSIAALQDHHKTIDNQINRRSGGVAGIPNERGT